MNSQFPGFPEKPEENYWQYPKVCNGWWRLLTGAEQKVLDYLLRHTWGYQKYQGDFISIAQFTDGIVNKKTKKIIDKGTGLSRPEVISSLKSLEKKGFITKTGDKKTGKINYYKLKSAKKGEPVKKVNSSPVKKVNWGSKESLLVTSKENLPTINKYTINNIQYREGDFERSFLKEWNMGVMKARTGSTRKALGRDRLLIKNFFNTTVYTTDDLLQSVREYWRLAADPSFWEWRFFPKAYTIKQFFEKEIATRFCDPKYIKELETHP